MLFDELVHGERVKRLSSEGHEKELEKYLLAEYDRLRNEGDVDEGTTFCTNCGGKSPERLRGDDAAAERNRIDGMIVCMNELAELYRRERDTERCIATYATLIGCIGEAGLVDSPIHLSALVNEAYARIDGKDHEGALIRLGVAEGMVGETSDPELCARLLDAKAVCLFRLGRREEAESAARAALKAIVEGSGGPNDLVSMALNHASALVQIGCSREALSAVDELLTPHEGNELQGESLYQTLNLKSFICAQMHRYDEAAEALSELIARAEEARDLGSKMPVLRENLAKLRRKSSLVPTEM